MALCWFPRKFFKVNNFFLVFFLFPSGGDKVVFVWDPRNGNMLHRLEGHKRYVTSCAFSDDNQLLATGSNDKTMIIWNLDNIKEKEINIELGGSGHGERLKNATNGDKDKDNEEFSLDKYVGDWSEAYVIKWIASIGFGKYAPIFRSHHIDGIELLHLTHDSLLMNLKIGLPFSLHSYADIASFSLCRTIGTSKQNFTKYYDPKESSLDTVGGRRTEQHSEAGRILLPDNTRCDE